jgi:hypothetical protein
METFFNHQTFTPTFILLEGEGQEILRRVSRPDPEAIKSTLGYPQA